MPPSLTMGPAAQPGLKIAKEIAKETAKAGINQRIDGAVRVRREAVTTLIAYQKFPANTYSMIARCRGMPGKNHVELALASFGRLTMVTSRTPSSSFNFSG